MYSKTRSLNVMNGKLLFLLVILLQIFCISTCIAKEELIEAQGIYVGEISNSMTIEDIKIKAKEKAMRNAVEKAGVYIESYSIRTNMKLTKNELTVISGEITQIRSIDYDVTMLTNKKAQCKVLINATVDTTVIMERLNQEKEKTEEMKKENDILKSKYEESVNEYTKLQSIDEKELDRLYKKATASNITTDEKLELTDKIISKSPSYKKGIAYALQADVYNKRNDYTKALECDLMHLKYDGKNAQVFYACAMDYSNLHDWENALNYINKAIKLDVGNFRYLNARNHIEKERNL